jgi:uncharacterized protein YndB with AHSA1/START domain
MHYEASTTIDAEPSTVWRVLTDVQQWPSWDSGVKSVEGDATLGGKVKVEVEANPGKAFPVKVTELDAPRRMVFTGGMPLGLFKGERTYTLEPAAPGGTRFTMREAYTGPLRPLIGRSIPDLQPSFDQFAKGLKRQAELRR